MRNIGLILVSTAAQLIVADLAQAQDERFTQMYQAGYQQLQTGDADAAVQTMRAALVSLEGRPVPDPTIFSNLAWAQMKAGRLDDAEQTFAVAQTHKDELSPREQQRLESNQAQLVRLKSDLARRSGK